MKYVKNFMPSKSFVKYNIKKAIEFLIKESKVKAENFALRKSSNQVFIFLRNRITLAEYFTLFLLSAC